MRPSQKLNFKIDKPRASHPRHDSFIVLNNSAPADFQRQGIAMTMHYDEIDTPFGRAIVTVTEKGINSISFDDLEIKKLKSELSEVSFVNELSHNGNLVKKFFNDFQLPETPIRLDVSATPFQLLVWEALLQIPFSELSTYTDIAKQIGKPEATRAVGTAIGKNPVAYLIPCHRVVRSDGGMGGYRWGLERKMEIHDFELRNF